MRAIGGLWRWRHNPLRRRTDLVEAWLALAAIVLILAVAPLVGAAVGASAQSALQQSVQDQREARHEVVATVVKKASRNPLLDPDPETSSGRDSHSRVVANWTAPDGTAQHGTVTAAIKSPAPGDHFTIWTDPHGRIVGRPLDGATATTHAVLAGFGAAVLAVGLVEGGRRLIVWRMVLRRYARWDRAWDKAGPDWGRTGAGS
ncbi:hypothetical protein [Streptomyces sp. NPDC058614]|uniref:Rv1733c family protein n=1 Tax=unclassified Streptomyces TaxID=2593676 RepID=UPI00365C4839